MKEGLVSTLWRRLPVCAAAVTGFAVGVAPSATAGESVTFSGVCDDFITFYQVDPARVRPFVPEEFRIAELNGQAIVLVTTPSCTEMKRDEAPIPDVLYTDVLVGIDPPPGATQTAPLSNAYIVWESSNSRAVREGQGHLGVFGGFVPGMTFQIQETGATKMITADVPWSYSSYSLSGESLGPQVPFRGFGECDAETCRNTFWHEGDRGLITFSNTFTEPTAAYASAALTAAAGSPLAQIIGGTSATASFAGLARLPFVGTIELVRPRPPTPRPKLSLTVRPRTTRAKKRTEFRFRATAVDSGKRRPVAGARIRFAKKTARTGRAGRAKISKRFTHRGRHHPQACKRGFRCGRALVRVVD